MSSPDPLVVLEVAARNELESLLMEFDGSWDSHLLDKFEQRIASHPQPKYRSVAMAELVKETVRWWKITYGGFHRWAIHSRSAPS